MEVVGRGGGENLDSQNLRDFLRIREEENPNHTTSSSTSSGGGGGLTLFAVLSDKRAPPPPQLDEPMQRVNSNRTLLDIIREDQTSGLGIGGGGRRDARRSWRHLKDKIRLRRRGNDDVWSSSTVPIPSSDVPLNNNQRMLMMSRRPSTRFNSNLDSSESTQPNLRTNYRSASGRYEHLMTSSPRRRLIIEEEEERSGETVDDVATVGDGASDQPVRMSLMALLEETDRQMGLERSSFVIVEEDEDVGEDISGGAAAVNGGGYNNCCVCMVRHKGAAFIPCGHTFCRLCSRELWVQRGHCPLCNNYILEILDIF